MSSSTILIKKCFPFSPYVLILEFMYFSTILSILLISHQNVNTSTYCYKKGKAHSLEGIIWTPQLNYNQKMSYILFIYNLEQFDISEAFDIILIFIHTVKIVYVMNVLSSWTWLLGSGCSRNSRFKGKYPEGTPIQLDL